MSDISLLHAGETATIDDRIRGFPAGHAPLPLAEIGSQGWKPYDGRMSLPLISLDRAAFTANADLMMRYVRDHGVEIAPHAKTPMSTTLAGALLRAGAWGVTVADIRQAAVMLAAGFRRLILANEIGGPAAARRLASLLSAYPDAEFHIFADSPELIAALADAWTGRDDLPVIGILVELGAARGGARSLDQAVAVLDAVLAVKNAAIRLSGIAAYEGAAATADPDETMTRIAGLMALTADFYRTVRARVGGDAPLIVTAGGSVFFDLVIGALQPALAGDPHVRLVLRSGAIFFHDHGVYERGLASLDARSGFTIGGDIVSASEGFRPALRLWAEVLSRPEPGLAICGMGLRDVAMDQGLPRPLALYRDGKSLRSLSGAAVIKLNDQHAIVSLGGEMDVAVGDVVEFGISHPCTCLDRYALIYGLDEAQTVTAAYATSFG
ncbi:amino acid deaminase [Phyllobacterium phragmitis]|uniref:Amino acid deaminase n=1 Tax=Phyllobacterium phragmitis TaxID=2670329 RepID=A0A2S9IXH3_9HYPH|nr:alanine racemase [Phyllobacterium phragmitis]PRD45232.1 amino acid deaminase [Phyllobacterium phragmitis]